MSHNDKIKELISDYNKVRGNRSANPHKEFQILYAKTALKLKLGPGVGIVDSLHSYMKKEYKFNTPLNIFKGGIKNIINNIEEVVDGTPQKIRTKLTSISPDNECSLATPGYKSTKDRNNFLNDVKYAIDNNAEFPLYDNKNEVQIVDAVYNIPTGTYEKDKKGAMLRDEYGKAIPIKFQPTHRVKCCDCYICTLPIYMFFSFDIEGGYEYTNQTSCGDCEHLVPVYDAFFQDMLVGAVDVKTRKFGLDGQYKCSHTGHNRVKSDMDLTTKDSRGKNVVDMKQINLLIDNIIKKSHAGEYDLGLQDEINNKKALVKKEGTASLVESMQYIADQLNFMYGAKNYVDAEGTLSLLVLVSTFGKRLAELKKAEGPVAKRMKFKGGDKRGLDSNDEMEIQEEDDSEMDNSLIKASEYIMREIFDNSSEEDRLLNSFYDEKFYPKIGELLSENPILSSVIFKNAMDLLAKSEGVMNEYLDKVINDFSNNKILYGYNGETVVSLRTDGESLPFLISNLEDRDYITKNYSALVELEREISEKQPMWVPIGDNVFRFDNTLISVAGGKKNKSKKNKKSKNKTRKGGYRKTRKQK